MQSINLITADVFIIISVFISVLVGLFRGATKEILSLLSWCGAVFLTIIIFPHAKNIARGNISHGLIADFVTACVLFIIFLTILSIFNHMCSNFVKKSALSSIDKFLGAIFGVLRGIIIVALIDITACQWFISSESPPKWITESKLRPHIITVSNSLILIMPNSIQDMLISHMSILNRDSLLKFINYDFVGSPRKLKTDKIITKEAVPINSNLMTEDESETMVSTEKEYQQLEEEAKNLATLKPKEIENKPIPGNATNALKNEKEKLDMSRLIDTTDMDDGE